MSAIDVPVLGVGLEAVDGFLSSDRAPPESMMLSELDGFLTGIAVGPELVMPSEWLPLVWGGEGPVFADEHETQAVLGGIFSRYNEILRQLADDSFAPIFWTGSDDQAIAADWAEGFVQAVGLRPEAWDPLFKSKEHALLLFPILALIGDEDGKSALGLGAETEDEVMAEAPALIPSCVMRIAAFWRERRPKRSANLRTERLPAAVRLTAKPGRNEPCPCGSGKKFKRCCGARP